MRSRAARAEPVLGFTAVTRDPPGAPITLDLIWRVVCQVGVDDFSRWRLVGGCGRLGGWRSGRLCATRGQTDIRGFGVAAGPWFVVGCRCLASGVACPCGRVAQAELAGSPRVAGPPPTQPTG